MCVLCGPEKSKAVVDHTIDHPFEMKPDSDFDCNTCGRHVSVHPDKMDFLAKRQMDNIIEYGHTIQLALADPSFGYTVGRTVRDRPELLVTGDLPREMQGYILNRVAELDDESPRKVGDELGDVLADGFTVRLVEVVDLKAAQMFGTLEAFGDDAKAIQVLWPDKQGHFPGDPGYDSRFEQPVFTKVDD